MVGVLKRRFQCGMTQEEKAADNVKCNDRNERKKAKIMNFSIAYGKTVHGFAKDWECTFEEAQQTVDLWYNDRPEVRNW